MSNQTVLQQEVQEILNECQQRLSSAIGKPVNVMFKIKVNHINPQLIIQNVCREVGVTYAQVISKEKFQKNVLARQLISWLATYYCGCTQQQVAEMINTDRTTVSHNITRVNDGLDVNDELITISLRNIETMLLGITKDVTA